MNKNSVRNVGIGMSDSAHSTHFHRSSVKNSDRNAEAALLTWHFMHYHRNVMELFLDMVYKYGLKFVAFCVLFTVMASIDIYSGEFVSIPLIYA